jgi:hypothetical protein
MVNVQKLSTGYNSKVGIKEIRIIAPRAKRKISGLKDKLEPRIVLIWRITEQESPLM